MFKQRSFEYSIPVNFYVNFHYIHLFSLARSENSGIIKITNTEV